jgi:hypothetical protein
LEIAERLRIAHGLVGVAAISGTDALFPLDHMDLNSVPASEMLKTRIDHASLQIVEPAGFCHYSAKAWKYC